MAKKDSPLVSLASGDLFELPRHLTSKLEITVNRSIRLTSIAFVAASAVACGGGGGSSSTPTAPTPTTTAVTVTVTSPIRMGQTAQATGTETLSNGQSQAVTTGWQSDAPNVATVTGGGLVTGVGNGRATIFVVAGGRMGQQVVRVVPDYQGTWSIGQRVTSCTESGFFADFDFCDEFAVGETFGSTLNITQSGEQITATPDYGSGIVLTTASTAINEAGGASFNSSGRIVESGITLTIDATFSLNSTRVGELTGTVNEVWRLPNISGEGRLGYTIVLATRSGAPGTRSAPSWRSLGSELADLFAVVRSRRR